MIHVKKTESTDNFEKDLFKRMNNSIFDKIFENFKKEKVDGKLFDNEDSLLKRASRRKFLKSTDISENLFFNKMKKSYY